MPVLLSDPAPGPARVRDPRRGRRALLAAGAVFAVAAGWAVVSASGLVSGLGRDAVTFSQELDAARYRAQPEFDRKVDGARTAVASAGWGLGPAAPLPNFECWAEADTTACDLFAHADGEAPMPLVPAQRVVAVDRILDGTNSALAGAGWRCTQQLDEATAITATDCTSGTAQLRVSFTTAGTGPALTTDTTVSRIQLRLDVSDRAYRSPGA
jgi:hypothetical protein